MTLGCARNEVDSEELAGRLAAEGFELVADADDADAVLVNTCGFIEAAKRESVDALLSAGGTTHAAGIAPSSPSGAWPSGTAPSWPSSSPKPMRSWASTTTRTSQSGCGSIVDGGTLTSHVPRDRRTLLPMAPTDRPGSAVHVPGHGGASGSPGDAHDELGSVGPGWIRRRITSGPVASLKIASGCDRRCAFCAIPSFRGSFVSRSRADVVAEAQWLAGDGVRELVLVSENSTSYGKDLADPRALEDLLAELGSVPGIERIRVSYLQPAEVRPGLVAAMLDAPRVADYFDLTFQHASAACCGGCVGSAARSRSWSCIGSVRSGAPEAGVRSNVIVGFPGETEEDVAELIAFLGAAQMDASACSDTPTRTAPRRLAWTASSTRQRSGLA